MRDPASFRDPAGFVYRRDGVIHRQVNRWFAGRWDDLVTSGLLGTLQADGLLVGHEDVPVSRALDPASAHAVIRPEAIDLISYPYEWSFSQLRDAALVTLGALERAEAAGFTLRDASAYNVQFQRGRPVLIDTLSFERRPADGPWRAYRQFCQHFLAPLALMAERDVRLGLLSRDFIDGIPLDLAATLLPGRSRLNLGLGAHVHAHARAGAGAASQAGAPSGSGPVTMTPLKRAALIDSLRRTVEGLRWRGIETAWSGYGPTTSYEDAASARKEALVRAEVTAIAPGVTWDLGANTGRFSAIAAAAGGRVVAWDADPMVTDGHYRALRAAGSAQVLPLLVDLANPSPSLGWAGRERASFTDRSAADLVLALALVHHLAIGGNVPLGRVAELFAALAPQALVEFVPREDPMVRAMLATREDIFEDYTLDGFRAAFEPHFELVATHEIEGSTRTLHRFVRRQRG
jgi:hypothetical protein